MSLLLWAGIIITASFACYASEIDNDFSMPEGGIEEIGDIVNRAFSGASAERQDFVFLNGKSELPVICGDKNTKAYAMLFDASDIDGEYITNIGICRADGKKSEKALLTIRYKKNDTDAEPVFDNGSKKYELSEIGNTVIKSDDNGLCVAIITLDSEIYEKISCFSENEYGLHVIRMVNDAADINIESISIEQSYGGLCDIGIECGDQKHLGSLGEMAYIPKTEEKGVLEYNAGDENLIINTSASVNVTDAYPGSKELIIEDDNAASDKINEGFMPLEISAAAEIAAEYSDNDNNTNTAAETEDPDKSDDISETEETEDELDQDIEERSYQSLGEGDASLVYADGYVYADASGRNLYKTKSDLMGSDNYINVYADSSLVGDGEITELGREDMPGSNYAGLLRIAMDANDGILETPSIETVESASSSEAGYDTEEGMTPETESADNTAGDSEADDAANAAETAQSQENASEDNTSGDLQSDPSSATDSEAADALNQDPTQNSDQDSNETADQTSDHTEDQEAADPSAYLAAFKKDDGCTYETEPGEIQLTEAFLKKASYCAVDDQGVICAFYNEHGRLVTLADGYSEDDIAAFLLIPQVSEEDKAGEIGIANITVKYNDVLAADDAYATVIHSDEAGNFVSPDANASVHLELDDAMNLIITSDADSQMITITGDVTDAEVIVNAEGDYTAEYHAKEEISSEDLTDAGGDGESAESNTYTSDGTTGPEASEGPLADDVTDGVKAGDGSGEISEIDSEIDSEDNSETEDKTDPDKEPGDTSENTDTAQHDSSNDSLRGSPGDDAGSANDSGGGSMPEDTGPVREGLPVSEDTGQSVLKSGTGDDDTGIEASEGWSTGPPGKDTSKEYSPGITDSGGTGSAAYAQAASPPGTAPPGSTAAELSLKSESELDSDPDSESDSDSCSESRETDNADAGAAASLSQQ